MGPTVTTLTLMLEASLLWHRKKAIGRREEFMRLSSAGLCILVRVLSGRIRRAFTSHSRKLVSFGVFISKYKATENSHVLYLLRTKEYTYSTRMHRRRVRVASRAVVGKVQFISQ